VFPSQTCSPVDPFVLTGRFLLAGTRNIKAVLVLFHPHSAATKRYAFGLEAQSLLEAIFARQHDFSAGSHHPMPGQAARSPQRPHYLPSATRKPGGTRNVAISGHPTFRNCSNSVADNGEQIRSYCARYHASVRRSPCSSVNCGS